MNDEMPHAIEPLSFDQSFLYMDEWHIEPPPSHPNCRCMISSEYYYEDYGAW